MNIKFIGILIYNFEEIVYKITYQNPVLDIDTNYIVSLKHVK